MFWLLMRIRLLSARNVVREALRHSPVLALGLTVLGIGLFSAVYAAFLFFFRFAGHLHVLPETVYQVFYFLFLFLLAGAVPFIVSTLLQSSDYGLLFAAPAPPRSVISAKLLDATVTNSLQFTVLGVPAIVACGGALDLPLLGWLLVLPLIVLFVLLPALITALALLLILAAIGMRRLRAAISLLNAVMAVTVCITIVLEARHLPLKPSAFSTSFTSLEPGLAQTSPAAHLSPSSWFATALLALARSEPGSLSDAGTALAVIVLVVGGLFLACMVLGGRLLSAASVAEENDDGGTIVPADSDSSRWWRRLFSAPIAAIILKDLKYVSRDSVLKSQLSMPLILFLVPFLVAGQDATFQMRQEIVPFAAIMIGVIVFMQTSILSLSSIGLESRSFWVALVSPNTASTLLWAKFLMSTLVSGGIGAVLTLLSGFILGVSGTVLLLELTLVVLCSAALCGLGVGISAALPRFVYGNPAHRVSAWALILGFFATIGYLIASAIIIGLALLLASRPETQGSATLIYGVGALLYLGLTAYAIYVPMAIGARRLDTYQWEH